MKNIHKKISYTLVLVFLLGFVSVSCEDDDSIPRRGKPELILMSNSVTVTEGETATFILDVEYPVAEKIDIRIDILDADGNPVVTAEGDPTTGNGFYDRVQFDAIEVPYPTWFESGWFEYGYLGGTGYVASFPAFTETIELNIETLQDFIPEGTETVNLRLSATSLMNATIEEDISIIINDFVGNDLVARLNWAGDYLDSGADACDIDAGLDLDLELIYGGAYVQTSYNDCPEELTILSSDADGFYTIDASFWTANGNTSADGDNIPVSIDFMKAGVFVESVDLSTLFPLNDGGLNDGNDNAITSFTVEKTGNTYTITDSNDTQIAQGRFADYRLTLEEKRRLKNQ
ncbi:hypothetical protein [Psychroserpens sp. SPM9]|uniref:hypothetical protein n=1 Tax=Psychroserpens sp. SPM9 TaxID=2975598 RepID=UPI0021A38E30|nr:hypothetical protein [Psychroserpens sp. SPM9]MDG5492481.1 hypothetical protein [Psychroserpens sp. SPM9]